MLRVHIIRRYWLALYALSALSFCGLAMAQIPAAAAAQQNMGAETAGSHPLHILVGHSVVIHTAPRLTRVLVGNPTVVTTDTTAPDEVVLTALAAGSSSVVLWQENNKSQIIEVFADVDVSFLRDAIAQSFPGQSIEAEAEEGRLVLSGTATSSAIAEQIGKMAAPFSKDIVNTIQVALPRARRQVLLKVIFAEVDRSKMDQVGVNLFSTGGGNTVGTSSTQQFGPPQPTTTGSGGTTSGGTAGNAGIIGLNNFLNIFVFRKDLNLGATIQALQQQNVMQILAEPNLLAANGEAASFLDGGELPYPVVSGAQGQSTVSVQFKPFGVKLEFTPIIESDNTIRLKVFQEVSALDFTNSVTISGFVLPSIDTRHAETVVELKDAQSFGIAGLLDRRVTVQYSKVPIVGDLPLLGQLFRSKSVNKTNNELVMIVTPSIVNPEVPAAAPEVPKMPVAPLDPKQYDMQLPQGAGSK